MEDTPKKPKSRLFLMFLLTVVLAGAGVYAVFTVRQQNALEAQEQKAVEMFTPALEALKAEQPTEPQPAYDIDKTVRIIHGLDKALEQSSSLKEYLNYMARQDYRGVAPEVLEGRKKVLDVLLRLYAKQTEIENQEATFTVTRTILSAMTMVDADLNIAAGNTPNFDREQAKRVLADLRKEQTEREGLLNGLTKLEGDLITVMSDYSAVYYKHIAEWDKLVVLRDRAYLAASRGNWATAADLADKAIELSPTETEAHLIKALALVQSYDTSRAESNRLPEAKDVLGKYVKDHPDKTAPALVLLGMVAERQGDAEGAQLNYQQAAAYFPKQAENLTDMLDPYRVRQFLRKTKEGVLIVDLYESTMLGAGVFSPDLHLARMHFEAGEVEKGRKKVLDHFSRRRNQAQWSLLLSDLDYCSTYLGPDFDQIFVERSHLTLQAEPTLLGSKLDVRIENDSPRKLYNATLLLALRFTDMHRDDWQVFKVGETVPLVDANTVTDFGTLEIKYDFLGQERGVDDIVSNRAILVTDDAVVWVDTEEYRLALARDANAKVATEPAAAKQREGWFDAMKISPSGVSKLIEKAGSVDVELGLGKDDFSIRLPKEVALLNPVFRVKVGDEEAAPTVNKLTNDAVQLEFGSVANFEADGAPAVFTVVLHSQFGEFEIDVDVAKRRIAGVRYK